LADSKKIGNVSVNKKIPPNRTMSLFPAYDTSDNISDQNIPDEKKSAPKNDDDWLENASFVPPSGSKSSDLDTKKRSKKGRKSRSRSKSRSNSSSPERKSRKKHSKSKKKVSESRQKKLLQPSRDELIAKHSGNKTFLEEVGVSPEFAFRLDNIGDRYFLTLQVLPVNLTSSYRSYFKRNRDEMCNLKQHKFWGLKTKSNQDRKRYHEKPFQKIFNKSDRHGNLLDLSATTSKTKFEGAKSSIMRFIHDFSADAGEIQTTNQDQIEEEEEEDFKMHEIQLKTKEFNERLRANPKNVQLWLDYVDFQVIITLLINIQIIPYYSKILQIKSLKNQIIKNNL
jgi:hypothetical protein